MESFRRIVFGLLAVLVGAAVFGCSQEKRLDPNEELWQRVARAGFEIQRDSVHNKHLQRLMDYDASRCFLAYHHPTTLSLCFHDFKSSIKALEAADHLARSKWPPGRFWVTVVCGRTVVLVDSQLKDRPVANKLASLFRLD